MIPNIFFHFILIYLYLIRSLKINQKSNYIKLETLKEFLHFPREYVDIPTLNTHIVSRK